MASTLPQLRIENPVSTQTIPERKNQGHWIQQRSPSRFNALGLAHHWHLASLDAPTVAVVWSIAFAWSAHSHLAPWVLPLEALVVWAAYVGDRLLDVKQGLQHDDAGMRDRHWFHWRHRRILTPLAIGALVAAACIAVRWMPILIWKRDSMLGLASLAYFARVHRGRLRERLFSKEMLVGVLFTSGCALPSLSWNNAMPITFFAALAWLNCAAIENWESSTHPRNISAIAFRFALIGFAVATFSLALQPRAALLLGCGAASAALLAVLDHLRHRLTPLSLRTFADLVLLTPAILLATASFR